MSKSYIRIALIGAGRWGKVYINSINSMPNVNLSCIASSNTEIQYTLPDECVVFSDWREALTYKNIDGIIIATPPASHAEIAEVAIKGCLPVLIEKPLTMDLSEGERLMDLATKLGAIIKVNHIHLFHPAYRKLKKMAQSSSRIRSIYGKAGNWGPFRKDTPVLWDWGAHDIAMCIDLLQELPNAVFAKRLEEKATQRGIGETILIRLGFPCGTQAKINISNLCEVKERLLKVETGSGNLIYDNVGSTHLIYEKLSNSDNPTQMYVNNISVQATSPLLVVVEEFCNKILENNKKLDDLILGLNVVNVLDKLSHRLSFP